MKNKYIIYKFTNIINSKVYIGVTKRDFNIRKKEHISLSNNIEPEFQFHKAIKKYGISNFKEAVIDECYSKEDANKLEIHYINLENSYVEGYNMTEGGGNRGNFSHSEKSKVKMRKSHKGKVLSEIQKLNISKSLKGKSKSKEHSFKVSIANTGKVLSKETKNKISNSLKGKFIGSNNGSAIKVNIYDKFDNLKYECNGNFNFICKINNLPSKALRKSYYKNGKSIYSGKTIKKEVLIKNKEFIGWYAVKIN